MRAIMMTKRMIHSFFLEDFLVVIIKEKMPIQVLLPSSAPLQEAPAEVN
jgi:hypothetical protein